MLKGNKCLREKQNKARETGIDKVAGGGSCFMWDSSERYH